MRLLVLIALVLLFVHLVTGLGRLRQRMGEVLDPRERRGSPRRSELVACATCGVHVPRARALAAASEPARGLYYCSETCRQPVAASSQTHRG